MRILINCLMGTLAEPVTHPVNQWFLYFYMWFSPKTCNSPLPFFTFISVSTFFFSNLPALHQLPGTHEALHVKTFNTPTLSQINPLCWKHSLSVRVSPLRWEHGKGKPLLVAFCVNVLCDNTWKSGDSWPSWVWKKSVVFLLLWNIPTSVCEESNSSRVVVVFKPHFLNSILNTKTTLKPHIFSSYPTPMYIDPNVRWHLLLLVND